MGTRGSITKSPKLRAELKRRREAVVKLAGLIRERNQLKKKNAHIFGVIKQGMYSPIVRSMRLQEKLYEVERELEGTSRLLSNSE